MIREQQQPRNVTLEIERKLNLSASVPAVGCWKSGIGITPEPKTGLLRETVALLNRLKNSAATSRDCDLLNHSKAIRQGAKEYVHFTAKRVSRTWGGFAGAMLAN